jgi:hypothetical protein
MKSTATVGTTRIYTPDPAPAMKYEPPTIYAMRIKEVVYPDGKQTRIWHSLNTKNHGQKTC